MNKILLSLASALMLSAVFADDELPILPAATTNEPLAKTFTTLPLCRRVEHGASVRKPGGAWQVAEEGKFYPFGTSFRAENGGLLVVAFGPGATVKVADGAEFGTRQQKIGVESRTISLVRGTVEVKLPDNLPEGMFFVTAPGFTAKNPAGESRFEYSDMGDGDETVVRCVTGSLAVEGRHFSIPVMHAANEVKIRTSRDQLSTILHGTSGDYAVKIDQGLRSREEFDDEGKVQMVVEKGELEWHLTPYTKVIINRMVPALGERMSVHTMAFDASGERKSECTFCEGRSEVNSGELVPREKSSAEELAKRAAEMTETTAVADAEDKVEDTNSEESTSTEEE